MTTYTEHHGLEQPSATTANKTAVYNAALDRISQGRRFAPRGAGQALFPHALTYTASGGWMLPATGGNRPLSGFVSSSGAAVSTITSGSGLYIQTDGYITNSTWAFTPGLPVYVHPTAAGSITQTAPASLAIPIAWAISSHQIALQPGGFAETAFTTLVSVPMAVTGPHSLGRMIETASETTTHVFAWTYTAAQVASFQAVNIYHGKLTNAANTALIDRAVTLYRGDAGAITLIGSTAMSITVASATTQVHSFAINQSSLVDGDLVQVAVTRRGADGSDNYADASEKFGARALYYSY